MLRLQNFTKNSSHGSGWFICSWHPC